MPSEGVSIESAYGDIGSTHATLSNDVLRARLVGLELHVLELRDKVTVLEKVRHELETRLNRGTIDSPYRESSMTFPLEQQLADMRQHVSNHLSHIARLEEALANAIASNRKLAKRTDELERMQNSTTWRVARALALPRRVLRRMLGR